MVPDATVIELSPEDRAMLERLVRAPTTEQRLAERARIVLLVGEGRSTRSIAAELDTWPGKVSRWCRRFAAHGLAGLEDKPRPGPGVRYGAAAERRVLALLDDPPAAGRARWTGPLLAGALGDVSDDEVWRILRRNKIKLHQSKSWCESPDPDFVSKAAEIVGLYLDPPAYAIVLAVDEKPHIQALERAQGYLRLSDGRSLVGHGHTYTGRGTSTLFAALEVSTGRVTTAHANRRRRRDFLGSMNRLVADHPGREIHVILDNLNTHKPKRDRWLTRHPNVHFHFTPTYASWLKQVETSGGGLVLDLQPIRPQGRQLRLAQADQGGHQCLTPVSARTMAPDGALPRPKASRLAHSVARPPPTSCILR